jgi:hypothetical protein
VTSAVVALDAERPASHEQVPVERPALELVEGGARRRVFGAHAAVGMLALVEVAWLATLAYLAVTLLR